MMRHLKRAREEARAKSLGLAPRDHAGALIRRVADAIYSPPKWAMFSEVRSHVGPGAPDAIRRLDAIALDFYPPIPGRWHLHGLEVKVDADDLRRELEDMSKSSPFVLCCDAFSLVVPAPYRNVTRDRPLPDGWGLHEAGAGGVRTIIEPIERQAEEPTPGFLRALFRSALATAERAQETFQGVEAPVSPITRPRLSSTHLGLGCGHVAPRPLVKDRDLPRALPCWSCAAGLPTDFEMLEAAALEVTGEQRERLYELLFGRRGDAA